MKKALSVILAVVMILSTFAVSFAAFATYTPDPAPVCTHEEHAADGECVCCVYCPYVDKGKILSCCRDENGNFSGSFCCYECVGLWPCNCECDCCVSSLDADVDTNGDPIFTEEQQDQIVNAFQKILKIVSDAFNKFFDAIFEFLRLGEVLPDADI
ncbi:MAG: hypothetical protein IJ262_09285 [Clostridia bacterium]|nr:hypothetical protein [Clostridia bacterium]